MSDPQKKNGPNNTGVNCTHILIDGYVHDGLQRLAVALLLNGPAGIGCDLGQALALLQIDLAESEGHALLIPWQRHEGRVPLQLGPGHDHVTGHIAAGLDVDVLGGLAGPVEAAAAELEGQFVQRVLVALGAANGVGGVRRLVGGGAVSREDHGG